MPTFLRFIFFLGLVFVIVAPPGGSKELPRAVVPLSSGTNSNQDKPTVSHFVLQPTGYKPRTKDGRSEIGKSLYARFNCAQCHSIKGQGGEVGPALDGIGAHRGREWLTARVLEPEKQSAEFPEMFSGATVMPHRVQKLKEAERLCDFLLTLDEPASGFSITHHEVEKDTDDGTKSADWKPQPENEASKSGRELFSSLHCGACHSLDGSRDRFGPDLAGIGARLSDKKLEKILSGAVRSAVMKKQARKLGDEQIFDIKSFLLTIPKPTLPSPQARN